MNFVSFRRAGGICYPKEPQPSADGRSSATDVVRHRALAPPVSLVHLGLVVCDLNGLNEAELCLELKKRPPESDGLSVSLKLGLYA
jgi:hypothetical protein